MDLSVWLIIIAWIFVAIWVPIVYATNKKIHPKALFILFFAEMWERFSYYGMRALLTLYMVKELFAAMDSGAADAMSLSIYGSYTSMVYLTPVIGGILADRIFGFRKAIIFGGVLMMLGHFALALEGMMFHGNMMLFFFSLALIIVGNGFFKPNISSFLGTFYEDNDPKKDGGFTIFYMGVNIGALLSILTCGYVGQEISWHYGFGLAGIGMGLGLIVFMVYAKQVFGNKGLYPNSGSFAVLDESAKDLPSPPKGLIQRQWLAVLGSILLIPIVVSLMDLDSTLTTILLIASVGVLLFLIIQGMMEKDKKQGQRMWVIAVLFVFHAVFWALFEQAGGSITLFTDRNVDRVVFGSELPASVFQFFNSLFIMLLAPAFTWIWHQLNKRNMEPSTPMKFFLGLFQLALGFGILVLGARYFSTDGVMPLIFLVLMYLLHTMGELSLSPVGLSMVTKLSLKRMIGLVMGVWFLSISLANKMAGFIGGLTAQSGEGGDKLPPTESILVYSETYLFWGFYVVMGAAALLLVVKPLLRKWMHGIH